jgi:micrococcal nuclease
VRFVAALTTVVALVMTGAVARASTVVNVVDGDTVDVQLEDGSSQRVRLIGIDAPERGQCFGAEASAHAWELLDGQIVALEIDPTQGDVDQYGRALAYVWLPDGRNFGEVMIADGFAREYTYDQPYVHSEAFKAAQAVATGGQLGMWSTSSCAAAVVSEGPFGPDRDCADFLTHAEAQAFYVAAGGPATDRHRLDADRDGIACEALP